MLDSAADGNQSSSLGLRMKELAAATGVPKSTILYYVNQGLLPKLGKHSKARRTGHRDSDSQATGAG